MIIEQQNPIVFMNRERGKKHKTEMIKGIAEPMIRKREEIERGREYHQEKKRRREDNVREDQKIRYEKTKR